METNINTDTGSKHKHAELQTRAHKHTISHKHACALETMRFHTYRSPASCPSTFPLMFAFTRKDAFPHSQTWSLGRAASSTLIILPLGKCAAHDPSVNNTDPPAIPTLPHVNLTADVRLHKQGGTPTFEPGQSCFVYAAPLPARQVRGSRPLRATLLPHSGALADAWCPGHDPEQVARCQKAHTSCFRLKPSPPRPTTLNK